MKNDKKTSDEDIFELFRSKILSYDPVYWIEKHLSIDGKNFNLSDGGWKPFADIYRYAGIKSLEKDSKPMVLVKSRQTGGTVMANAIELFFLTSGVFGVDKAPMRIIHAFPALHLATSYSKTKFTPMVNTSIMIEEDGKKVPYAKSKLDLSSRSNDSINLKMFKDNNHLWIDSTGMTGDRLRGKTVDAIFFDECFPYNQNIAIENGKIQIGEIYDLFIDGEELPLVKTYNENNRLFEYKKVVNAWKRGEKEIVSLICGTREIKCTDNHRFLTINGWKRVYELSPGDLMEATENTNNILIKVDGVKKNVEKEIVYDIEVEDNHNFIVLSMENDIGLIAHNCQDMTGTAITNSTKMLNQSQYGPPTKGVCIYFGTPKRKGSDFHRLWMGSNQQYYYLGCGQCGKYFALYEYGSDSWKDVWIEDFTVKCSHCGFLQDKREAAGRGKWLSSKNKKDSENSDNSNSNDEQVVGFHINQLYMPHVPKNAILAEEPGTHLINTERVFRNEVMGEFFDGNSGPLTIEDIREYCGVPIRKFYKSIPASEKKVYMGIDFGLLSDISNRNTDKKQQGQSYTTAVIIVEEQPKLFFVAYAYKFPRNDLKSKKAIIDELMRQYSVNVCVGDIGYSNDISPELQMIYGDKYLVSRAVNKVNHNVKYQKDVVPKEITFDKDYYYAEMIDQLKKGQIKFPLGSYDYVFWLMEHCSNIDMKATIVNGLPSVHYVKAGCTDGFTALLNAYLGYQFVATNGFENMNIFSNKSGEIKDQPLIMTGRMNR